MAEIQLRQGDVVEAMSQVEPVLAYLVGGGDFDSTEYRLRNQLICYQVLQASGDPRAATVLQEAYEQLRKERGF